MLLSGSLMSVMIWKTCLNQRSNTCLTIARQRVQLVADRAQDDPTGADAFEIICLERCNKVVYHSSTASINKCNPGACKIKPAEANAVTKPLAASAATKLPASSAATKLLATSTEATTSAGTRHLSPSEQNRQAEPDIKRLRGAYVCPVCSTLSKGKALQLLGKEKQ